LVAAMAVLGEGRGDGETTLGCSCHDARWRRWWRCKEMVLGGRTEATVLTQQGLVWAQAKRETGPGKNGAIKTFFV
jgi:hypothetical protein